MTSAAVYGGLFLTALLAATILPFQSESALLALLLTQSYSWSLLIVVATAGNVLGAVVNWFIGLNIARLEQYSWFPIKRSSMTKAEVWYQKYGKWSLLLSWVPIIGDPLTIAAGIFKERLIVFVAIVTCAKSLRYLTIAGISFGLL